MLRYNQLKLDFFEDFLEIGFEVGDGAIIDDKIIGHSDRTAFFHMFDFAVITFTDGLGIKGAIGAFGNTLIAEFLGNDDSDKGEGAWKFVKKSAIFGPRIDAVDDDTFLTSIDEVFGFGDSLARNPIGAFGFANHFAKSFFAFAVGGALDATFLHFAVNHAAEIDFGKSARGEVVNCDGFTAATHANDGEDFEVVVFHDDYYSMTIPLPYV